MGQWLVSILVITVTAIVSVTNQGSFFVRYEDEDSISAREENMQTVFHKSFHRCTLDEDCNFIMKNINGKEYRKVKNDADLPANRNGYQIWIKIMLKDVRIEEKTFEKESKQLKYLANDPMKR